MVIGRARRIKKAPETSESEGGSGRRRFRERLDGAATHPCVPCRLRLKGLRVIPRHPCQLCHPVIRRDARQRRALQVRTLPISHSMSNCSSRSGVAIKRGGKIGQRSRRVKADFPPGLIAITRIFAIPLARKSEEAQPRFRANEFRQPTLPPSV